MSFPYLSFILILLSIVRFFGVLAQAAGTPKNVTVGVDDGSIAFSSGWQVAPTPATSEGVFVYTNVLGAEIMIALPKNATDVYYVGYTGPSRVIYATCMDCSLNLTRILAVHTLDPYDGTHSPTILFAVTGIDPSNAHSLSVINLLDPENAKSSQLTFGGLVATVEDNGITNASVVSFPTGVPGTGSTPSRTEIPICSSGEVIATRIPFLPIPVVTGLPSNACGPVTHTGTDNLSQTSPSTEAISTSPTSFLSTSGISIISTSNGRPTATATPTSIEPLHTITATRSIPIDGPLESSVTDSHGKISVIGNGAAPGPSCSISADSPVRPSVTSDVIFTNTIPSTSGSGSNSSPTNVSVAITGVTSSSPLPSATTSAFGSPDGRNLTMTFISTSPLSSPLSTAPESGGTAVSSPTRLGQTSQSSTLFQVGTPSPSAPPIDSIVVTARTTGTSNHVSITSPEIAASSSMSIISTTSLLSTHMSTSPQSQSSTGPSSAESSGLPNGLIIGVALGASFVVLCILAAVILLLGRARRRQQSREGMTRMAERDEEGSTAYLSYAQPNSDPFIESRRHLPGPVEPFDNEVPSSRAGSILTSYSQESESLESMSLAFPMPPDRISSNVLLNGQGSDISFMEARGNYAPPPLPPKSPLRSPMRNPEWIYRKPLFPDRQ